MRPSNSVTNQTVTLAFDGGGQNVGETIDDIQAALTQPLVPTDCIYRYDEANDDLFSPRYLQVATHLLLWIISLTTGS